MSREHSFMRKDAMDNLKIVLDKLNVNSTNEDYNNLADIINSAIKKLKKTDEDNLIGAKKDITNALSMLQSKNSILDGYNDIVSLLKESLNTVECYLACM